MFWGTLRLGKTEDGRFGVPMDMEWQKGMRWGGWNEGKGWLPEKGNGIIINFGGHPTSCML